MNVFDVEGNLVDELTCGEEGFVLENPYSGRSVRIVGDEVPHQRYQLAKCGMVADLTNSEIVAVNFLMGG